MKHRTIIFPVILHPPSQDGIEHPRQVFQGFVAPQLEFPASDFLSDGLCSFVAYSRQEAHEVFPPVVSSPPGSELIAQEGKLLVLMRSSSFGSARWHHRHTAQRGCLGTCAPSTHRSRSARKGLPARERLLLLAAFPFLASSVVLARFGPEL